MSETRFVWPDPSTSVVRVCWCAPTSLCAGVHTHVRAMARGQPTYLACARTHTRRGDPRRHKHDPTSSCARAGASTQVRVCVDPATPRTWRVHTFAGTAQGETHRGPPQSTPSSLPLRTPSLHVAIAPGRNTHDAVAPPPPKRAKFAAQVLQALPE
jgi:hypothetical protein